MGTKTKILIVIAGLAAAFMLVHTMQIMPFYTYTSWLITSISTFNISSITSGPGISTIVALGGTAGVAWKKLSDKGKELLKTKQDASQKISEVQADAQGLLAENSLKAKEIEDLKLKLGEYESQNMDVVALQQTISQKDEALSKAQTTIDTLHETLKRNKLSANEEIVKTVVI